MRSVGPLDRTVKVSVSDDGLECRAMITPGADRSELSEHAMVTLLQDKGIVNEFIDHELVARFVAAASRLRDAEVDEVVAEGVAPRDGIAGHFEFAPEIREQLDEIARREHVLKHAPPLAGGRPGTDGNSEGIDFYDVSAFVIVRRGAMIGTVLKPTPGIPGQSVTGVKIPAADGDDVGLEITDGLEVVGGSDVRAGVDGRLIQINGQIRVEEALNVNGAVDFSTGNIEFPGDVHVIGGVKDLFRVRADGDVEIKDLVEAAHIETSFDVTFATGMAGREVGTLAIGGALAARYLDGVTGRIDGPCRIQRELNACDLQLGSALECGTGVVMGGRLRVAGACEIGQLGGQGGVGTIVMLGWLEELETAAREIRGLVETRIPKPKSKARPDRRVVVALLESARRIASAQTRATSAKLTVNRTVHPGVQLVFRGWTAHFRSSI